MIKLKIPFDRQTIYARHYVEVVMPALEILFQLVDQKKLKMTMYNKHIRLTFKNEEDYAEFMLTYNIYEMFKVPRNN